MPDDTTTPDDTTPAPPLVQPSKTAAWLGILILVAAAGAAAGLTFWLDREPLAIETETFVLFAGFYAAAQGVERLMETAAAPWFPTTDQGRANKGVVVGAFATLAAVVFSAWIGLYFLHTISGGSFGSGDEDKWARSFDVLLTGLAIGGGTKPLHDLIKRIEKSKENAEEQVAQAREQRTA
jgi:hypothetical protein